MSRKSKTISPFTEHHSPERLVSGRKAQIKSLLVSKPLTAIDLARQLGYILDDTLGALADLEREKRVFRSHGKWHLY